ncbi:hypothetical protein ACQR1I_21880 [Bradyrhizobium sp. HKCCYLS2038]|uniref:hypothetical protein n=1 Tax=unclassified Bradyrhizobium TaxID=2631580 RepID=UPI003EBEA47F
MSIFGANIDPTVNISADMLTTREGLYVKGEIIASLRADKAADHLTQISRKVLPQQFQFNSCTFEIQSATSLSFTVVGNTGDLQGSFHVAPHGCLLVPGNVSISMRFAPAVDRATLRVRVARIKVVVPSVWSLVGFIANKDPSTLIAAEVKRIVEDYRFSMPPVDHVRAALQGASLDQKANELVVRIRMDAQVAKPALLSMLLKSDAIKDFSFNYP